MGVKKFYGVLLLTWLCLGWNWLSMICCVFGGESKNVSADGIWSSLYLLIGVPASWRYWYRSIYYGMSQSTTSRWCLFLAFFGGHTVFCIVMTMGIEGTGAGGLFFFISVVNENKHESITMLTLIALVLWIVDSVFSVHLFRKAHAMWKSSGQPRTMQQDLARTMVEQGMQHGPV